VNEANILLFWR